MKEQAQPFLLKAFQKGEVILSTFGFMFAFHLPAFPTSMGHLKLHREIICLVQETRYKINVLFEFSNEEILSCPLHT